MTAALARFVEAHGRALVLVFVAFAVAGIVLTPEIPVSIFPQTDFPRISIRVDNGIAPIDVQMLTVTRPLEETIRTVPGITTVRSITARGGTEINVFFRWDVDVLNALHLVQGRISQIMPSMPPDARFIINRLTFSVFPMIGFSITSPSRSLADLWELAYYDYAPRLYRLPGVAETRIVGGRPKEYHVIVDPQKLNGYGIPLSKVADALRATNMIDPAGMMQENYHLYLTTVTGLLREPEQIRDVVVDVVKGTPVQIRNVATVVPGEEPVYNVVTANGRPAVLVNVMQQPDGNSIEIADAVNRELGEIKKTLPKDAQLSVFYDQSILVRDSINGVVESILIGLVLSVAVLMGFLKNWRTTAVAAMVIPIAVLLGHRLHAAVPHELQPDDAGRAGGVHRRGHRRRHRDGREHQRPHGAGPGRTRGQPERDPRADPGADRLHADADHGLRAAGVPGRHHGGILPRAGDDDGDGADRLAASGVALHAGAGAAVRAANAARGRGRDHRGRRAGGRRPHHAAAGRDV